MVTVGRLAREYKLLPSEVLARATTYDIMIMDVLATYEHYQDQLASGGQISAELYQYSEEELKAMMEQTRGPKNS